MKTPKFRTNYSNLKLQGSEQRVSRGTGRREWWLSFYCACGEMFSTTLTVANQANAKQRPLRCAACQRAAKSAHEKGAQRHKAPPRVHTFSGDYQPQISAVAIRLLNQAKQSRHYSRIMQIVAASVRGSLKARIVPEWERIIVEATELANMEANGATLPGDWTRETIAEGLSITSFPQYRAPIDSSVS